jgi:hypothetical protein
MDSVKSIVNHNAIVKKAAQGIEAARLELLKPDITDERRDDLMVDILFFADKGATAAWTASVEVGLLGKKVREWLK